MPGLDDFPTPNRLIKFLYSVGLGFLVGRIVLLLTTKGRRTGLPRTTPLQYEEHDGKIYVMSAMGPRSDWYRNILVDPRVDVRMGTRRFEGFSEATTDPVKIANLLELRLKKRPWMVGRILEADGLPRSPSREELEEYSAGLAMVEIKPLE
jgi:deazaflavin-dependent oxidoreductase (nitroreductase family)